MMAQGRGNFDDTNNATTGSPPATTEVSSPVPETTTEDIFADIEVIIGSLCRLHCNRYSNLVIIVETHACL